MAYTNTIKSSEITSPELFNARRTFLKGLLAGASMGLGESFAASPARGLSSSILTAGQLSDARLESTPETLATRYNNYYELSFDKTEVRDLARLITTDPWSVEVCGEVEQPCAFQFEDLLRKYAVEERTYRFRCVEAWSMVVPWIGFPLSALIKAVKPLSSAKFVKFTSLYDPLVMPKQEQKAMLDWPYVEALRIDEAMHPLTFLAVGMYGKLLPKQNGAPLRLVVPWKYGFKSIKAIVKIELVKNLPVTSWSQFAPNEYGFYANVNPAVPHPRWSQSSERPLGSRLFTPRRATELFNGYAEQVAFLYQGMDLRRFF